MLTAIKGLFSSKKFWLTIVGSAVVGGLHYAGVSDAITLTIGSLFGVGVAAQGAADFGKVAAGK